MTVYTPFSLGNRLSRFVPNLKTYEFVGMWPEGADGTDINTCIKSHSGQYLVSGDDWGSVNIFTYPCVKPKVIRMTSCDICVVMTKTNSKREVFTISMNMKAHFSSVSKNDHVYLGNLIH